MSNQPQSAQVADLGRRVMAALIDRVVPLVVAAVWMIVVSGRMDSALSIVVSVICSILLLGWLIVQWWLYGTRKAGLGYRIMGLELVGLDDGKAIGLGRMLLRTLIFNALSGTGIGWILFIVFLTRHPRRQGWHDLAVGAIAIQKDSVGIALADQPGPMMPNPQPRPMMPNPQPRPMAPSPQSRPMAPSPQPRPMAPSPQPRPMAPSPQPRPTAPSPSATAYQAPSRPHLPAPSPAPAQQALEPKPAGLTWQEPPAASDGSSSSPRVKRREPQDDLDYGGTRLVDSGGQAVNRPGFEGWYVQLDDGRTFDVAPLLLIGRNPQPRSADEGAALVSCGEPSSTISKNHLLIGVDIQGAYVVDLDSTNGTALVNPVGTLTPCEAGVAGRLNEGQTVSFGERTLIVRRYPEE